MKFTLEMGGATARIVAECLRYNSWGGIAEQIEKQLPPDLIDGAVYPILLPGDDEGEDEPIRAAWEADRQRFRSRISWGRARSAYRSRHEVRIVGPAYLPQDGPR